MCLDYLGYYWGKVNMHIYHPVLPPPNKIDVLFC